MVVAAATTARGLPGGTDDRNCGGAYRRGEGGDAREGKSEVPIERTRALPVGGCLTDAEFWRGTYDRAFAASLFHTR